MIPAITGTQLAAVRRLEDWNAEREQTPIVTRHLIHAGVYHRTIRLEAGTLITGALIKRATTLIVSGDVRFTNGEDVMHITGYHVLPASAFRKQAFLAHADTHMTMLFATNAKTVEEAEAEFTEETDVLISRRCDNVVTITGE